MTWEQGNRMTMNLQARDSSEAIQVQSFYQMVLGCGKF